VSGRVVLWMFSQEQFKSRSLVHDLYMMYINMYNLWVMYVCVGDDSQSNYRLIHALQVRTSTAHVQKNDYIWYRYSYKSPKIWPYKKASPSFKASLQQEKQHHWRTNTRRRVHRDCTSCSCPVASHRWPLTASRRWLSVAGEDWEMLVHIGPI